MTSRAIKLLAIAFLVTTIVSSSALFMMWSESERRALELQKEVEEHKGRAEEYLRAIREYRERVESLSDEVRRLRPLQLKRPTKEELKELIEEYLPQAQGDLIATFFRFPSVRPHPDPSVSAFSFYAAQGFMHWARKAGYNVSFCAVKMRVFYLGETEGRIDIFALNGVILADGSRAYVFFWPSPSPPPLFLDVKPLVFGNLGQLSEFFSKERPVWAIEVW
ncbi:MAG: hypothetical protein QXG32_00345 [Candidatus Bathyarchaeia archaeon]